MALKWLGQVDRCGGKSLPWGHNVMMPCRSMAVTCPVVPAMLANGTQDPHLVLLLEPRPGLRSEQWEVRAGRAGAGSAGLQQTPSGDDSFPPEIPLPWRVQPPAGPMRRG